VKPPRLTLAKPRPLTDEERALFRQAVADARPLRTVERVQATVIRPSPHPKPRFEDGAPLLATLPLGSPDWIDIPSHDGMLTYRADSVSQRLLRELRRGVWPIAADLDLHGVTRDEAMLLLSAFLSEAFSRELRCIRIVHGKGHRSPGGQSALKVLVRRWLSQCGDVLAFCETPPAEGGSGAVKVLLRRPQRDRLHP